ncbi:MAG: transketolase family protein [Candidatus Humimicrobiaceae bacterium]|jgi:transketolase|nr:transketolase family protein [Actinomycetota bacterium]MDY0028038.1 transketolase family protein [Candidatus Humimicrobiaceae bacterium]
MIHQDIKKILSSEDEKISTREAYGMKLAELGEIDKNIVVLDCDLSKSTRTAIFAKKFPERFFNFGLAEANMMSAAAGLATMGKIPFASTFGVFATKRACDQVSISIAYPRLNVKICATHTGISVGEDGATHQAIEDAAIMRSFPNMVVISPADGTETRKVIDEIYKYNGPCYVRLCRGNSPVLFNDNYEFKIGRGVKIMDGDKATLISAGFTTSITLEAAKTLEEEGIEVDMINMASIKPIDSEMIVESAKKTGLVITVEDHNVIGGLGSAVCEVLSENYPVRVIRLGVKDKFGSSGSPAELIKAYGFDKDSIVKTVRENIPA